MQISDRRDDPRRTLLGGAFMVIYVTSEENRCCYATRDVKHYQPAKFQNDRTTFIFYRQRYRPTLKIEITHISLTMFNFTILGKIHEHRQKGINLKLY